ncbi:MAG: arginine N-succinyltransferase [Methylophaga sp.]|nr:MAG: arginine N-succinyltransferase [Methylophaga sp.]
MSTFKIVLLTFFITVIATFFAVKYYLSPRPFTPVELSQKEESTLNAKLQHFGLPALASSASEPANETEKPALEPEAYTEEGAKREISFSEKELNALLARNTDLADKIVIDLADNLASAKIIIPLDPDFPILGGKTLKVTGGAEFAFKDGRPVVILKGVSIWGVPIPNSWLGNLKNVDLVSEFGGDEGFWKSFAEGVSNIQIEEGQLKIKLKE